MPAMFQNAFPFPVEDFYGYDDRFASLSNVKMETPISVFNDTYSRGMKVWDRYLPVAETFDVPEGSNETSQSLPIIVQKIFLAPRPKKSGDYYQHELFFVKSPSSTVRSHYSSINQQPMEAITMSEFQEKVSGLRIEQMVKSYNPMGFIFNYVEASDQSQQIAYACGGLVDILNIWHVTLIPGMKLYIVAYEDTTVGLGSTLRENKIIPVASLNNPITMEPFKSSPEKAILEIGTLCTINARPPLQSFPDFLRDVDGKKPTTRVSDISNTCKATISHVQGNILRVNLSHLRWQFFS